MSKCTMSMRHLLGGTFSMGVLGNVGGSGSRRDMSLSGIHTDGTRRDILPSLGLTLYRNSYKTMY